MANMIKVKFASQGSAIGETVWAEEVGDNLFRLANIPFHITGYAENDIVRCLEKDGFKEVVRLEHDSGNGTIRLLFLDCNSSEAKHVLDELKSVNCSIEIASNKLVGVNVPPNLDIEFSQLSNYLNGLGKNVLTGWEVAKRFTRSQ